PQHIIVIAVLQTPEIDDHVDFLRAVVDRGFGFEPLGVGVRRSERKADDRRHFYVAAVKQMASLNHPRSVYANSIEMVLARLGTEPFDVFRRGVRSEQRVVDIAGEVLGLHREESASSAGSYPPQESRSRDSNILMRSLMDAIC